MHPSLQIFLKALPALLLAFAAIGAHETPPLALGLPYRWGQHSLLHRLGWVLQFDRTRGCDWFDSDPGNSLASLLGTSQRKRYGVVFHGIGALLWIWLTFFEATPQESPILDTIRFVIQLGYLAINIVYFAPRWKWMS